MKMYSATIKQEPEGSKLRDLYYSRQKRRFILVVALVLVVPLIAISLFSYQYYKSSWIDKTSTGLGSLAESRREIIDMFLADQQDALAAVAALYPVSYLAADENLSKVYDAVNQSGVMTDMSVVAADGEHIAYVGPFSEELAGRNYAGAEWFRSVMEQGSHVSDIFSGFRGVPHFVVAVTDPSRTWVLRATVNSDMFNSLLTRADVGPGGDAFIINHGGELQTPSRIAGNQAPFTFDELPLQEVTIRQEGEFIYAATALKGGDWMLVLETDIDSSLAGFYSARNKAIAFIILSIAVIVTAATLIISSMIDRLREADRKRMELNERMREVEKMALVGRLAASVAHEINNPLQIIENQAGWIGDLLEDEAAGNAADRNEYRDAAEKIRAHVRRAREITHGLLGFARTRDEQEEPTDINRLLTESASFLETEARGSQIRFDWDLQEGLPLPRTDASQLQQVFLNIINNAIDAIGRDGVITIRTSAVDGNGVMTELSDSGPGMPEEVRASIFDPFFSTKDGKNTGLGMSISYNIIKRLGGDIEARNGEYGGSVFRVTLPGRQDGQPGNRQEKR